jgi:hypothetical protein
VKSSFARSRTNPDRVAKAFKTKISQNPHGGHGEMHRIQYFCIRTFCFCALLVVAGCGFNPVPTGGSTSPITSSSTPPPPTTPSTVTEPSVYVMGDSTGPGPSVLVFPQTASGQTSATLEIQGDQVSLDGAGNVYVLDGSSINEYLANSLNGPPTRSLPLGPGTAVGIVKDVMASSTGEIFVSDGTGIAVFSPQATGNATPVRYILGPIQQAGGAKPAFSPGFIAVDDSDNTYAQNTSDSTIVVFGPKDTGNVVPARTISGPLTRVSGSGNYITGMTTDTVGNLYVVCLCMGTDGTGRYDFGVFEFDPAANGDVAPKRYVSAPKMYPYFGNDSVAVDSAGTIYVSAIYPNFTATSSVPAVFEFSASDSGTVAPLRTVTLDGWTSADSSRIAVH